MLNIGILGCGKIAQVRHIPEYHDKKSCFSVILIQLSQLLPEEWAVGFISCSFWEDTELIAVIEIQPIDMRWLLMRLMGMAQVLGNISLPSDDSLFRLTRM